MIDQLSLSFQQNKNYQNRKKWFLIFYRLKKNMYKKILKIINILCYILYNFDLLNFRVVLMNIWCAIYLWTFLFSDVLRTSKKSQRRVLVGWSPCYRVVTVISNSIIHSKSLVHKSRVYIKCVFFFIDFPL